jgi:hypothetical protein
MPDEPLFADADRAYGGAGRDVLIANTGADRLIDWLGEYNSYVVPFAPFGLPTVSRAAQPQLAQFLYDLSKSDGADQTRIAPEVEGADPERNGEPFAELGLVRQQDDEWQDQTGAPADPQPGNTGGVQRDVMAAEDFNDGLAQAFVPDSGTWSVIDARYLVDSTFTGDGISLFYDINEVLPEFLEIAMTVNMDHAGGGTDANAFVIFDYQSEEKFKFAGISAKLNKLWIGQRTVKGWLVETTTNKQFHGNTDYELLVRLEGPTATLLVDGVAQLSHTFVESIAINVGLPGLAAFNSVTRFDDFQLLVPPPEMTFEITEDFSDGMADEFTTQAPKWRIISVGGDLRFEGTPYFGDSAITTRLVDVASSSILQLAATVSTESFGGLIFDYYGPEHFKFAAILADTNEIVIGHRTAGGWFYDAAIGHTIVPGSAYDLAVSLEGTMARVSMNGEIVLEHVFFGLLNDGELGLVTRDGDSVFDDVVISGDDPALSPDGRPSDVLVSESDAGFGNAGSGGSGSGSGSGGGGSGDPGSGDPGFGGAGGLLIALGAPDEPAGPGQALTADELEPLVNEAIRRWIESAAGHDLAALLGAVTFEIADLPNGVLGQASTTTILIDINASGHGWFVDPTPFDDAEFTAGDGALVATELSPAFEQMDLLTVLMHELGHVVGLEDLARDGHEGDLMSAALATGVRLLPNGESLRPDEAPLSTPDLTSLAYDLRHLADRIAWVGWALGGLNDSSGFLKALRADGLGLTFESLSGQDQSPATTEPVTGAEGSLPESGVGVNTRPADLSLVTDLVHPLTSNNRHDLVSTAEGVDTAFSRGGPRQSRHSWLNWRLPAARCQFCLCSSAPI